VVVLLTYNAGRRVYTLSAGADSAYRIRNGVIGPMAREVAARRAAQPLDARVFFAELKRLSSRD